MGVWADAMSLAAIAWIQGRGPALAAKRCGGGEDPVRIAAGPSVRAARRFAVALQELDAAKGTP